MYINSKILYSITRVKTEGFSKQAQVQQPKSEMSGDRNAIFEMSNKCYFT